MKPSQSEINDNNQYMAALEIHAEDLLMALTEVALYQRLSDAEHLQPIVLDVLRDLDRDLPERFRLDRNIFDRLEGKK